MGTVLFFLAGFIKHFLSNLSEMLQLCFRSNVLKLCIIFKLLPTSSLAFHSTYKCLKQLLPHFISNMSASKLVLTECFTRACKIPVQQNEKTLFGSTVGMLFDQSAPAKQGFP